MNTLELLSIIPVVIVGAGLLMTIGVLIYKVKRTDKLLFKDDGSLVYARADDVKEEFEDMKAEIWEDHEKVCALNSMKIADAVTKKLGETQIDMAEEIAKHLKKLREG